MDARVLIGSALIGVLAALQPAQGVDIDSFATRAAGPTTIPNVLFIVDNSSNWSNQVDTPSGKISKYAAVQAGLSSVFSGINVNSDGTARFNVGLMMAPETGSPNSSGDGGYIRAAVRPMTSTTRQLYADAIDALTDNATASGPTVTCAAEAAVSPVVYAVATPTASTPGTPVISAATATGCNAITLSWNNVDGENSYVIERKGGLTVPGSYIVVGTEGVNKVTFTDTTVGPSTTYTYRVRATKTVGTGSNAKKDAASTDFDLSAAVSVTTPAASSSGPEDQGNAGYAALLMAEAYRYFTGGAPIGGAGKVKADFTGNTATNWGSQYGTSTSDPKWRTVQGVMQQIYALGSNALSSLNASAYNAPPAPQGEDCVARNYIIYISNGPPQDNQGSARNTAQTLLSQAGGNTTTIPVSPSGAIDNMADEWARFMRQDPVAGVTTYTIDVAPSSTGTAEPAWTALLKSMAKVGEGRYVKVATVDDGGAELANTINRMLIEILAVNSVFASVSLPVSVNTQGTYLNQVFIGQFRPEGGGLPRWPGNLKQYRLALIDNTLRLVDAAGDQAINANTGFLRECARSYWTPSAADTYWSFSPRGQCPGDATNDADALRLSNYPDGNLVEKGAQAYVLRAGSPSARDMRTCILGSGGSCTEGAFATTNNALTAGMLGLATNDSAGRSELINWLRGVDIDDENANNDLTEMRPSAHGDVLHSRPAAINYGVAETDRRVIVFYGGNDGVFRAINGNRTEAIGGSAAGSEMWRFVPPEYFASIGRMRNNNQPIDFPDVVGGAPKPYGIDGIITAFQNGTKWHVIAGMRRGGRALYAFETELTSGGTLSVNLGWRAGCDSLTSDTNCSTGYSGLGQTWARPSLGYAAGYGSGNSPLLFMAGGYDACEDADPATCTTAAKGRGVYVIDALTGILQAVLPTDRSVIADVAVVPGTNGKAELIYVADLGGNLYRANVSAGAPSTWSLTKIAALGCDTPATCANNRKFMFQPDIIKVGDTYFLLLGTGDREKPLTLTTGAMSTPNHFFVVKDEPRNARWLTDQVGTCGSPVVCKAALYGVDVGDTPSPTALAAKSGWYLNLQPSERIVTSALTLFGSVSFSSFIPYTYIPNSCRSALGTSTLYTVKFDGTTSTSATLPPVGLPPSPTAGTVTLDTGETVPFCIGCSARSPLEATFPEPPPGSSPVRPKRRTYWFIER